MIIRTPEYEDVDQLVELGSRMHEESAYRFLPYDRQKVTKLIHSYIEDRESQCGLVAVDDQKLAGMLGGYLTDYFFCDELLACDMVLFIDKPYRGGMTAARLIRRFRSWALERGAREFCLGISTNINVSATGRFYERMGLKNVGGIYKQLLQASQPEPEPQLR